MYSPQDLETEVCSLRYQVERTKEIQQAILTRLAQIEVELRRLAEPLAFDRYDRTIEKLAARLEMVESQVTDLQGEDCLIQNHLHALATKVDAIPPC